MSFPFTIEFSAKIANKPNNRQRMLISLKQFIEANTGENVIINGNEFSFTLKAYKRSMAMGMELDKCFYEA